jgi:hypothetical protein
VDRAAHRSAIVTCEPTRYGVSKTVGFGCSRLPAAQALGFYRDIFITTGFTVRGRPPGFSVFKSQVAWIFTLWPMTVSGTRHECVQVLPQPYSNWPEANVLPVTLVMVNPGRSKSLVNEASKSL